MKWVKKLFCKHSWYNRNYAGVWYRTCEKCHKEQKFIGYWKTEKQKVIMEENIVRKVLITLLYIIVGLFVSNWVYNHIDAWVGVLAYLVTFILTILYINNQIKKHNKNEED